MTVNAELYIACREHRDVARDFAEDMLSCGSMECSCNLIDARLGSSTSSTTSHAFRATAEWAQQPHKTLAGGHQPHIADAGHSGRLMV